MRPLQNVNLADREFDRVSTDANVLVVRKEDDGSYRAFDDPKDKTAIINESTGKVLDIHGKDYKLLENSKFKEIVQAVTGNTFKGYINEEPSRVDVYYYPDKNGIEQNSIEVEEGDTIRLGLRFSNSYDGSTALRVQFVATRLVCDNGMTTQGLLDSTSTRHTINALDPEEFKDIVYEKYKEADFDLLENILREAKEVYVDNPVEWIEAWGLIENVPKALIKHLQLEVLKNKLDKVSRYKLYNMGTRAVTHGYVKTQSGDIMSNASTYSESYLQRIHHKINSILTISDHEIDEMVSKLREKEELSEKAEQLKMEMVAEP